MRWGERRVLLVLTRLRVFEELRIGSKIKINWESDRVTERETNKKRKEKDGKKYTEKKKEKQKESEPRLSVNYPIFQTDCQGKITPIPGRR